MGCESETIIPQRRNANKHTPRGMGELERSIQQDGWIGAVTVAADGETFDGSARVETLATAGLDEPLVIETDGRRPVILRRTDIPNADDERAKRLAIAANKIAADNLAWDAEILATLSQELDLSSLFRDEELAMLLEQAGNDILADSPPPQSISEQWVVIVTCQDEAEQQALFQRLTEEGHQCRLLIS